MFKDFTPKELAELECQLSKPTGENGKELGLLMNDTNKTMTSSAYQYALLSEGDQILEIGHGNGAHINEFTEHLKMFSFLGAEVSSDMYNEALIFNKELILQNKAQFHLYDGDKMPFPNYGFNKIITVNTLYFWKKPLSFLNHLFELLKEGGKLILVFADKEYMNALPFVKLKFNLFGLEEINTLIHHSFFNTFDIDSFTENINSKIGDEVIRTYHVVTLIKKIIKK